MLKSEQMRSVEIRSEHGAQSFMDVIGDYYCNQFFNSNWRWDINLVYVLRAVSAPCAISTWRTRYVRRFNTFSTQIITFRGHMNANGT